MADVAFDVIVARTHDEAKPYRADNPDAVLISASCHPRSIAGLRVGSITLVPGVQGARDFRKVLETLLWSQTKTQGRG